MRFIFLKLTHLSTFVAVVPEQSIQKFYFSQLLLWHERRETCWFSNASCTLHSHGAWTNNAKCCNSAIGMITGYFEKIIRILWNENAPNYVKIWIEGKIVDIVMILKNTKASKAYWYPKNTKGIFISVVCEFASQFASPSFLSDRKLVRNTSMILTGFASIWIKQTTPRT